MAVAHNGSGTEITRDQVVVNVGTGLRLQPRLVGVPLGDTALVHLSLSTPQATELTVTLRAINPAVVTLPQAVVFPAGETEQTIQVTSATTGSTTILASSSHGTAAAIVSVSEPVAQQPLTALAPAVGVTVRPPPSLGHATAMAHQMPSITVTLLPSPATEATPVTVFSRNPAVVTVLEPVVIPAGSQAVTLPLTTGQTGVAIVTLQAGSVVRQLTVIVSLPVEGVPLTVAPIVGVIVEE